MTDTQRIQTLSWAFSEHADPKNAGQMKAYMKNLFPYWGIKTPLRRQLSKDFIKEVREHHKALPTDLLLDLWKSPQREFQYAAIDLSDKYRRVTSPADLPLFERLITEKSWWDTVDALASHHVGAVFKNYPDSRAPWIPKWLDSGNIWLQRTCIIFQLGYKLDTDWNSMTSAIEYCLPSKESFIQKAIGWALREYGKHQPAIVVEYVRDHESELPALSKREALKRITRGK